MNRGNRNENRFTDTTPPENAVEDETTSKPEDTGESMIVHRETYMDGTVQKTREHGPMPVSEWPAYEKEHGL